MLSSNISPTCSYNMVNFSLLAAEIVSLVWGTPTNFNGLFHVLAALLHSHTAALNRRRHLYSAGRPSRWALAHISSFIVVLATIIRLRRPSFLQPHGGTRAVILPTIFAVLLLVMVALSNRADHYIFALWFLSSIYLPFFFFSSPNLSGHRSDDYHTSPRGVALVRI